MRILFVALPIFSLLLILGCQTQSDTAVSDGTQPESGASTKPVSGMDVTPSEKAEGDVDTSTIGAGEDVVAVADVHSGADEESHGPEMGHGPGMGRGFRGGRGPGGMAAMRPDMTTIHGMFGDRDKIRRTVKMLPNGAEATTESDDSKIAALIQDHVPNMDGRVVSNEPLPPMTFHPVFVELIKNADKYTLDYEETETGVKVTYHSDDPYVVMLVQEHAKLVSRFIKNGMEEIHADYDLPKFDEKTAAARTTAIVAREVLFKRLSSRLMQAIETGGPAGAIEVCSQEAPQIAEEVGKEKGVRIGRTALRLRNPGNAAPDWAAPLLETQVTEAHFVNLENDKVGALLPIRLQAKCVTCHGPRETLEAGIAAQLAKHYPSDAATGFREGDIRGWFWVEVPTR